MCAEFIYIPVVSICHYYEKLIYAFSTGCVYEQMMTHTCRVLIGVILYKHTSSTRLLSTCMLSYIGFRHNNSTTYFDYHIALQKRPNTDPVERRIQAPEKPPPGPRSAPLQQRHAVVFASGDIKVEESPLGAGESPVGGAVYQNFGSQNEYEPLDADQCNTSGRTGRQLVGQPNQASCQRIDGSQRREPEEEERYCDLNFDAMNMTDNTHISSLNARTIGNHYVNLDAAKVYRQTPKPKMGSPYGLSGTQEDDEGVYDDVSPPNDALLRPSNPTRTQGDRSCKPETKGRIEKENIC